MDEDKTLEHVTQEVLTFIAFKVSVIKELKAAVKSPSVSAELIENLRKIVWVERYIAWEDVQEFLHAHFCRMTSTPQLYTTYVIYACHLIAECFDDPYEKFVRTLTIVIQIAIYSIPKRMPELLGWSLAIFTNFFQKELGRGFYERGGWKKFGKYLLRKNSLGMYQSVEQLENRGKRPDKMAEILKIQATQAKEYLDKNAMDSSVVENHGPTMSIWEMVETNGFAAGSKFMCELLESQSKNVGERRWLVEDLTNMAEAGSETNESRNFFFKPGHIQPLVESGTTNRIAYLQAKSSLSDLQTDCLKIEQMLDSIFGDTQESS